MRKNADVNMPNAEGEFLEQESSPECMENVIDNNFSVTLSRSLAKQLNNLAKYEGICSVDLILELLAEGIARRIMEDQTRPAPSHLMTRNGYVQDQQNSQPSMSHHAFSANGNVRDNQGGNRCGGKNNFQRTPRMQNNQRYNNNNRNTQNNYNNKPSNYFKPPKKSEF